MEKHHEKIRELLDLKGDPENTFRFDISDPLNFYYMDVLNNVFSDDPDLLMMILYTSKGEKIESPVKYTINENSIDCVMCMKWTGFIMLIGFQANKDDFFSSKIFKVHNAEFHAYLFGAPGIHKFATINWALSLIGLNSPEKQVNVKEHDKIIK